MPEHKIRAKARAWNRLELYLLGEEAAHGKTFSENKKLVQWELLHGTNSSSHLQ